MGFGFDKTNDTALPPFDGKYNGFAIVPKVHKQIIFISFSEYKKSCQAIPDNSFSTITRFLLQVLEYLLLALINNALDLARRHLKLFCESLIGYVIYEPSLHNSAILLVKYPLVDGVFYFASGIVSHLRFLTRTFRAVLLLLPDRVRLTLVTLTLAIMHLSVQIATDIICVAVSFRTYVDRLG